MYAFRVQRDALRNHVMTYWEGYPRRREFYERLALRILGKLFSRLRTTVSSRAQPLYMDTNFCNLLNIWDRVFKTYQPEQRNIK